MEQYSKLATCYGFIAVIIWSNSICLSRSLIEKVGMLTASESIYLLGGMISIFLNWIVRRLNSDGLPIRSCPWHLIVCGIPFVLYNLCLYLAIGLAKNRQQVIEVGLLNYLWPTFTLIFSVLLLKKRTSFLSLPGTTMALSGVLLANIVMNGLRISITELLQNCSDNAVPYLLGLAAAILWGLYSNLTCRFSKESNIYRVPFFLLTTGILLQIVKCVFSEQPTWTNTALVELSFIVFLPTITAYVMWNFAMRCGNMLLVVSFAYFTPLLSTILFGLYLGANLTVGIWGACTLVIAGAWISKSSMKEKMVTVSSNLQINKIKS